MILEPVFRQRARRDLVVATRWYERQRRGLGSEFHDEVGRALYSAAATPNRFPVAIADVRRIRMKRFPFEIYFRTDGSRLRVLAVFHVRRDPKRWRAR